MNELPFDAKVTCKDGRGGTSVAVTLNPVARVVTHLVVEDNAGEKRIVPLSLVSKTSHDEIWLNCSEAALKEQPLFEVTGFVERAPQQSGDWEADEEGEWEDGVDVSQFEMDTEVYGMPVVVENVPNGEIAFHRKTDIEATDGHVGEVAMFVVNPENGHIMHLVLHKGHLWGKKDLLIPISAVESLDYDSVYLNVTKADVDQFSELPK